MLNAKNVKLSDIQNDSLSKRQNTCFVGHVYNLKHRKEAVKNVLADFVR